MKVSIIVTAALVCLAAAAFADQLSRETQVEIIQAYMYATGQMSRSQATSLSTAFEQMGELPVKCGTPAIRDFVLNQDKLDPNLLKELGTQAAERPAGLDQSLVSPSGIFRVHYTTSGDNAVASGYPESVAAIFDEVYSHLVDDLGYPPPPSDGSYDPAGPEFDVYLVNFSFAVYGMTYLDSVHIDGTTASSRATAFMLIDNDYAEFSEYQDRPLDAVRVTCAHEFFHVVQYGIDFTEGAFVSLDTTAYRSAWMEMSATWMEEEMYDQINDYYFYLPFFFREPYASIRRFINSFDLHPYSSMLYPLFLSEKYSPNLIRDIWLGCATLGMGTDDFLESTDNVISTYTGGDESFASSFHEFMLWNYYTGSRAHMAPDGIGYSERNSYLEEFLELPGDSNMAVHTDYTEPINVGEWENIFSPDHNGAFYLKLNGLQNLVPDTTYWACLDGTFPACNDSVQVDGPPGDYDIVHVDSVFTITVDLDSDFPYDWGFNTVFQLQENIDSTVVAESTLTTATNHEFSFYISDLQRYRSATMMFAPASPINDLYNPFNLFLISYSVESERTVLDSTRLNLPAAMFTPYPNPAVASELGDNGISFKFQVPTDSLGVPIYGYYTDDPYIVCDIFSVAGDHVGRIDEIADSDPETGEYWIEWNLRNASGKEVASGVYIAVAQLFASRDDKVLLTEEKTKVLVIR
ncbi:MAG: MXAN_6640 family putative metalloprotease [Candidatus Zixiibacteriota bacterium]